MSNIIIITAVTKQFFTPITLW